MSLTSEARGVNAMKKMNETSNLTIDGVEYAFNSPSDIAVSELSNVKFVDERIAQLQNELAISNTARAGYLKTLKADLARGAKSSG